MKNQVEKFTDFITQIGVWSNQIKEQGLRAIEQIHKECDGDEKVLKAILLFIMGINPDLIELVNTYYGLDVASPEATIDENVFTEAFDGFCDIINKKFDDIYALLASGKTHKGLHDLMETGDAIDKFARCQLAIVDNSSLSAYQYIFDAVTTAKDSLDKLQEQIIADDQDKILEELIAFKKTTTTLENHIQKILIGTV
ncbi:MAG TPA: hypothetical protein VIM75_00425 [Ohtaekwangia sp.]|uniref:hypothetical protein n=1 Tax=Ohtaekwangia sp. TaxID=2066019 RepID=UPI002F95CE75